MATKFDGAPSAASFPPFPQSSSPIILGSLNVKDPIFRNCDGSTSTANNTEPPCSEHTLIISLMATVGSMPSSGNMTAKKYSSASQTS